MEHNNRVASNTLQKQMHRVWTGSTEIDLEVVGNNRANILPSQPTGQTVVVRCSLEKDEHLPSSTRFDELYSCKMEPII